jgi:uncharacterized protein HemX
VENAENTETPEPEKTASKSSNTGSLAFVLIAVLVVGGVGYYVKIYRPKQLGNNSETDDYDDEPEDFNDDEEIDIDDEKEENI